MDESRNSDQRGKRLVILTGASGSGKTTLANRVAEHCSQSVMVQHFDAIEVPTLDDMIALHGSPEEWQRRKTQEWMSRLGALNAPRILFEGQSRIQHLVSSMTDALIHDAKIILVDCRDGERERRLKLVRRQPELATEKMLHWAAFLRQEAREFGCEVLDTSEQTIDECVDRITACFQ